MGYMQQWITTWTVFSENKQSKRNELFKKQAAEKGTRKQQFDTRNVLKWAWSRKYSENMRYEPVLNDEEEPMSRNLIFFTFCLERTFLFSLKKNVAMKTRQTTLGPGEPKEWFWFLSLWNMWYINEGKKTFFFDVICNFSLSLCVCLENLCH